MMIVIQLICKCECARCSQMNLLLSIRSVIFFLLLINDEHSLPVWLSHSTMWKNETNKKEHQTGQCQPLRYHVHDDIIKIKWTNYYGKGRKKTLVNKTKYKNYNYFWPLNGFPFFLWVSFLFLSHSFACSQQPNHSFSYHRWRSTNCLQLS